MELKKKERGLDGFLNLAGSQATGTHPDSFHRALFQDLDALQVGIEFPGADVMGM